ncbi:MAG: WbuC family cupin fold metalloprotein [Bacteroidales bacterium]|nr:WbuC family cupin fold metalloprotein [Bacteroidales bacterium]MCF8455410.1 WbuC family cupin fold metalloprotein [Bacteroidales bacterium]
MIKIVNKQVLTNLSSEAAESPRLRKNLNLHEYAGDPLQRMLNAFEPGTYICPHKHENPDKRELFILMKGIILVVIFDNKGVISDSILLDRNKGNYAVEIAPRTWHTVVSMEQGSVAFEIKDGPYDEKTDKFFAPWAPPENHTEAGEYLKKLVAEVMGE